MHPNEDRQLHSLLVKAYNASIQDFYYFPEVILAGEQKIERTDFEMLLCGGYIVQFKHDSFGRFYKLSEKSEHLLRQMIVTRSHARKKNIQKKAVEPGLHLPGL